MEVFTLWLGDFGDGDGDTSVTQAGRLKLLENWGGGSIATVRECVAVGGGYMNLDMDLE